MVVTAKLAKVSEGRGRNPMYREIRKLVDKRRQADVPKRKKFDAPNGKN
jgi:hypothetical protein